MYERCGSGEPQGLPEPQYSARPRPATPAIIPAFGPLTGIWVVSTGIMARSYIGTKMAEFGAEGMHVERPGGDPYRGMAPLLTRGLREYSCDGVG